MQKKFLDVDLEIRAVKKDDDRNVATFEGYGSVFGVKDSYSDIVEKGAFVDSLKSNGIPAMLWQHRADMPIGVWTEAKEDNNGLILKGEINLDVQAGKEAYALIKQEAIKGLSIGFITEKEEYVKSVRILKQVRLMEVSLVTFPANKEANVVSVKGDLPDNERDFEKMLRDIGYGQTQSKAIVSKGFKGYLDMQRDVDKSEEPETVQRDVDVEEIEQKLETILTKLEKELENVRRNKKTD